MKRVYDAMATAELTGKLPHTGKVLRLSNINDSMVAHIYFQECDEQGDYFVTELLTKQTDDSDSRYYRDRHDNGFEAVLALFREHEDALIPAGSFLCTVMCTHEQRIGQ